MQLKMPAGLCKTDTQLDHSANSFLMLAIDNFRSALYIGHPLPNNAVSQIMRHFSFDNLNLQNAATIFAVRFVASPVSLRNNGTNPGSNLDNILDGVFERTNLAFR